MAAYLWTGRTRQGLHRKGEVVAHDRDEVVAFLKKEQLLITSIRQKPKRWEFSKYKKSVGDQEIVVFTRQLASMVDAGLPLVQCLEILSKKPDHPLFSQTLSEIRSEVEGGMTFADALKRHPMVFDELYVNMVTAGEAAGSLNVILKSLAEHIEKVIKLKRKIKAALVYPVVVVGVAVVVITILMIWVIPIFEKMYSSYGGELPLLTQFLIYLSDFIQRYILLIIAGIVASVCGLRRYYRTPQGRRVIDKMMLQLPVISVLIKKLSISKATRTLGMLIPSGVPILEALTISAKVSDNKIIEEILIGVCQKISEGATIADPLGKEGIFPEMVIQMIAVGETTGSLDVMLNKVADIYEGEVDAAIDVFTSLLEPLLMVFVGLTIGTIVIAMYLPIFKLASLVG